jgi:hypothetical protein
MEHSCTDYNEKQIENLRGKTSSEESETKIATRLLRWTLILFCFLLAENNYIHSFKYLIKYIRCKYKFNIGKNKKDKSANKLTVFKLIEYNGKMTTSNMIKIKIIEIFMLPYMQR